MEKQNLKTLGDFMSHSAKIYADRMALVLDNNYLTYNQLHDLSKALAGFLQNKGIKKGGHVAIISENSPNWGLAFFGIVKTGATAVCLDVLNSEDELLYVLDHSETTLCFASKTQIQRLSKLKERTSSLEEIIDIDQIREFSSFSFQPQDIDPSSTAILIYTSGTMGNRKGVMLSHTNIISNIIGGFTHISFRPGTNFLSLIPLSHMFGINAGFLAPLYKGAAVTYVKNLKSSEISKALKKSKAEILVLVPLILKKFYDQISATIESYSSSQRMAFKSIYSLTTFFNKSGISMGKFFLRKIHKKLGGHLKFFISGGAPLEEDIGQFFDNVGIPVLNGYGLTETSPIVSVNSLRNRKNCSVGMPIPEVKIEFSEEGEILIRGPSVMKGYYKDDEATREVIQDGWFKSGDIGEIDKDGYLFIKDRAKNVIVLPSGLKIFPNEIEQEIGRSPFFIESCVVKRITPDGEEPVVVLNPDPKKFKGLSLEEKRVKIRAELEFHQKKLPAYMKVFNFEIWRGELPKTTTKKIKRKTLEKFINSRSVEEEIDVAAKAMLNNDEEHIASLIRKFLNKGDIYIDLKTNLGNDLGIDSIMKIELIDEIEKDLKISIPEEIIYTIESFDDLIDSVWRSSNNIEHISGTDQEEEEMPKEAGRITKTTASLMFNGMLKLLYRIEVVNGDRIPKNGSFIIAANHSSMLDFPVLSAILPKEVKSEISVPAAHDYFFKKSFGTSLFRAGFNIIPMKRYGNYYDGLKICSQRIKEGKPLIVFPEGTRSVTGELQKFKPGVGMLAVNMNVPVIPIYIKGAYRALPKGSVLPKPGKISVIVGNPVVTNEYKSSMSAEANYMLYNKVTDEVKNTIEMLKAEYQP